MKPKVKIYNYESGYTRVSIKDEAPMDLSVKRSSPENLVPSFHNHRGDENHLHLKNKLFHENRLLRHSSCENQVKEIESNLLPNLISSNERLLIVNRNTSSNGYSKRYDNSEHLRNASSPVHGVPCVNRLVSSKQSRLEHDHSKLNNFSKSDKYSNNLRCSLFEKEQKDSHHFPETKRLLHSNNNHHTSYNGNKSIYKSKFKNYFNNLCSPPIFLYKSKSESSLDVSFSIKPFKNIYSFKRSKSETDLNKINFFFSPYFVSDRDHCVSVSNEESALFLKKSPEMPNLERESSRFHLASKLIHGRKTRLSDEEDMISDEFESDDALDLRTFNSPLAVRSMPSPTIYDDSLYLFHHINSFVNSSCLQSKSSSIIPTLNPWDIYKQYYYYLLNQPSFESRAVASAAMTESCAKILNPAMLGTNSPNHSMRGNDFQEPSFKYASSSSFDLCNGKTELRSADTTIGVDMNGERKRISRPLTGRHVRHGTGASPQTLLTLRNMIQERQKMKEMGFNMTQGKHKSNRKSQKRK